MSQQRKRKRKRKKNCVPPNASPMIWRDLVIAEGPKTDRDGDFEEHVYFLSVDDLMKYRISEKELFSDDFKHVRYLLEMGCVTGRLEEKGSVRYLFNTGGLRDTRYTGVHSKFNPDGRDSKPVPAYWDYRKCSGDK